MGKIICEKHGTQGSKLVCSEILNQVRVDKVVPNHHEVSDLEIPELHYQLCADCFSRYAGMSFEQIPLDPVCGKCFNEAITGTKTVI